MPKVNLSDRTLRALATKKSQEDFWDSSTPGLGVRVSSTGRKKFFCRYRLGKAQRRMVLGVYPGLTLADARKKFRAIQNRVDDGRDPQLEKQVAKAAETVGELFDVFFADREGRIADTTLTRYKGIYRREFEKPLGGLKAKDVRKAHVVPLFRQLGARAPTQCERAQELLQACFNHGVALDLLEFNALLKLPAFGETRMGERHLSPREVRKYLQSIDKRSLVESTYFYFLLFFGARPGELASWRWDWIKGDRIIVPGEFQKNGKSLVLPLTSIAEKKLMDLHEKTGETPWLFPNPAASGPRNSFRKHKLRLEDEMELQEPWVLRDIRRTTETLLRELPTGPNVVSVILNHNTSQLGKIYDKSVNLAEKRKALDRFEKYLQRLKNHKQLPEKVIQLAAFR